LSFLQLRNEGIWITAEIRHSRTASVLEKFSRDAGEFVL
jgi:hypothetical protein